MSTHRACCCDTYECTPPEVCDDDLPCCGGEFGPLSWGRIDDVNYDNPLNNRVLATAGVKLEYTFINYTTSDLSSPSREAVQSSGTYTGRWNGFCDLEGLERGTHPNDGPYACAVQTLNVRTGVTTTGSGTYIGLMEDGSLGLEERDHADWPGGPVLFTETRPGLRWNTWGEASGPDAYGWQHGAPRLPLVGVYVTRGLYGGYWGGGTNQAVILRASIVYDDTDDSYVLYVRWSRAGLTAGENTAPLTRVVDQDRNSRVTFAATSVTTTTIGSGSTANFHTDSTGTATMTEDLVIKLFPGGSFGTGCGSVSRGVPG